MNPVAVPVAAVLGAMVLVVLDAAIANVALPTLAQSLQVTAATSIWVVTAYQMALLMALLPCAALGEGLGYRRVFASGVALFVAASALCAAAPSLEWLVAARFLQGLGGAAVMALGVALLRRSVPAAQLGAAIGWNALAVALASAGGPAIGAAILSSYGWPWLFAVNVPLGLLVLLAARTLPGLSGTARPFDRGSAALNAAAFAALVIGAERLPGLPAVLLLIAAGTLWGVLVKRELPKPLPLIPFDLLRCASFSISVGASVCCFTGVSAAMVALPFYLQQSLGQDAWRTGLFLTPWPLTSALAAPLVGRLADRLPSAWLCAAGGVCLAIGLLAASLFSMKGHPAWLLGLTMLCGFGFVLFQVPNNRNLFLAAPLERSGAAGGMQATARLAGQTTGAVIMTLLFTLTSQEAAPGIGLAIAAGLTLAAALVSTLRVKPVAPGREG